MPWPRSMERPASARARSPTARWSSGASDEALTPVSVGPVVSCENMPDQGKLDLYAALVRAWAPKLDLVSPADLERFEERHIADSLRVLDLVAGAPQGPCCDVGSGAGLPGIPLAIASERHWR